MSNERLSQFVKGKIDTYVQHVKNSELAGWSLGELEFYTALRNVLYDKAAGKDDSKKCSYRELGLLDAMNDTLRELGLIGKKDLFYDRYISDKPQT